MKTFTTHNKEVISGKVLKNALNKVAADWEQLGESIYKENACASHVPEAIKLKNKDRHYTAAAEIRAGLIDSFTIWQRVNMELTGECVALLP